MEHWEKPIRRMPFESSKFTTSHQTYLRQYWNQLDKADQARADSARICECGAANVYDTHTEDCWARPLRELPCERKGFKLSGPLPYKWKQPSNTGYFKDGRRIIGGWMEVLSLSNALFKGKNDDGTTTKLRRLEAELQAA